ncbi:hypothetical protein PLICRDRAFT_35356 [Plicaturopsis crispa FD-325 SS-3]|nr:hypothetical protein PLICRDRAFT_35356 [Plicaturopsis crispa FD-325 SS-3]
MTRRKPASSKQRKADLQLKRAVKRGDLPPPEPKPQKSRRPPRQKVGPNGKLIGSGGPSVAAESTRKLQSAFIKLPPHYLEDTKALAGVLPLPRPLGVEAAIFADPEQGEGTLSCPTRPKWRFDMTKIEVEKNEEGVFRKWIAEMDERVDAWVKGPPEPVREESDEDIPVKEPTDMPRAPTYFERNIEVWRQLWRVTEISQIMLVLLDARCPLLHLPPPLLAYLSLPYSPPPILVLTKVDIAGPARAAAWTTYLETRHPGLRVVQVEAYREKTYGDAKQGGRMWEPGVPEGFRARLVEVVRELHAKIVSEAEGKRPRKRGRVKKDVDWEAVMRAGGEKVGSIVGGAAAPRPRSPDEGEDEEREDGESSHEPEFLTIGLIGQPNVGKSSLLNALFGTHKVRASKTPGKTKHFQTLFWTPQVRLVDCPGLVFPALTPMPTQVLAGILPISRVNALPACVHLAAQHLPLERVFGLVHPRAREAPAEDKRTWRGGEKRGGKEQGAHVWTAMDVLTAYADKKGWVTAKAGRPDVNRAGNAILRLVAEGKVRWAFWPPGTDPKIIEAEAGEGGVGNGVWIPRENGEEEEIVESESDEKAEEESGDDTTASEEDSEDEDEHTGETAPIKSSGVGRFGALSVVEDGSEDEDVSDEPEDDEQEA